MIDRILVQVRPTGRFYRWGIFKSSNWPVTLAMKNLCDFLRAFGTDIFVGATAFGGDILRRGGLLAHGIRVSSI